MCKEKIRRKKKQKEKKRKIPFCGRPKIIPSLILKKKVRNFALLLLLFCGILSNGHFLISILVSFLISVEKVRRMFWPVESHFPG